MNGSVEQTDERVLRPTYSERCPPHVSEGFERWFASMTRSMATSMPSTSRKLRCDNSQSWQVTEQSTEIDLDAADQKSAQKDCKKCERWRDELARESPIIRFMLQHIALLPPPEEAASVSSNSPTPHLPLPIACQPCGPTMAGGYSPTVGVLLCQNRLMSRKHMEDALAHELIHAWDGRRFSVKGDWGKDLRAHACTEIRAENLSGDCRWGREFTRRNMAFTKQHQACVRRRAILSVAANPYCLSQDEAAKAVNEVWESCFSDTRPFDEIY